ncbi:SDR family NAD(P)-dependent oxidoreductase [Leifsonia sp. L25]|uniref:SDR family NAD(P)-dependent oxidoreductase n=1 Tax=Leifsonia sp. L25 TaxID=3423957 RepID=UPI003D6926E3
MTERVTTPFDARSTADDVIAGVDLAGRRAIVTGGAAGLGFETARALAQAGAEVTIAARRRDAAESAADDISQSTGNPKVHAAVLDLADLQSVRRVHGCVERPAPYPRRQRWDHGHARAAAHARRSRAAVRHQSPGPLRASPVGLHDALAAAGDARVVVVSSVGHVNGPVRFDDTLTSPPSPTTRGWPMPSRRAGRTSSSPWRPAGAGRPMESP